MLTQEEVRRLFDYDPDTGIVTRRISVGTKGKAGAVAGCVNFNGRGKSYLMVGVNRKTYLLHRIIWLYVYGEFPDQIDHINGNGRDNRLSNLRDVSPLENAKNRRKQSNNTSGISGVSWNKERQKWDAHIKVDSKKIHLGRFSLKEEAAQARQSAGMSHQFHVNHGQERPL